MERESYKFTKFYQQRQETRWAGMEEIKAANGRVELASDSYSSAGLPVLNNGTEAYVDNSDTHSLIFGSTGSKKTRLFCIPMLHFMIGAGESIVTTDPKGELYQRTSGFAQAHGYHVVVLNYRDLAVGDNWNPLALPYRMYSKGDKEGAIACLNDFVNAISKNQMEHANDIFWVNAARSVALSILIFMLESCTKRECNMQTFTRFCIEFAKGTTDKAMSRAMGVEDDDIEKNYLEELMQLAPEDCLARLNYDGIAGSSDRARGDVQSTLFTLISVFMTQELLVRNMSRSTFNLTGIARKKTIVYLIVPDEKTTFNFVVTTFIKQCYETLIAYAQTMPNCKLPTRVNFVLDEFANIPTIPDMPAMITAARSRNMRFFLVVQSMHQLCKKYDDEAQTIKGNCENWVFLSSKEIDLLTEISKLCGNLKFSDEDNREWPLISVSQLQRLNKQRGEALIFCGRQYPFISELADIDDCNFAKYPPLPFQTVLVDKLMSISPQELFYKISLGRRNKPFVAE